jgi:hypothetical protein
MFPIVRLITIGAGAVLGCLLVACEPVKRLDVGVDAPVDQRAVDSPDRPMPMEPPTVDGGPDQRVPDGPVVTDDAPVDRTPEDRVADMPPPNEDRPPPPPDMIDVPSCPGADGGCGPGYTCNNGCIITPSAVEGLVLWLDAAEGITTDEASRVSSWRDRSPLHHDAYQLRAASRPLFEPAAGGGRPAIKFGGGDAKGMFLRVADSAKLQLGRDDFLLFVVATARNSPLVFGTFLRKQSIIPPFNGLIVFVHEDKLSAQLRYADVVVSTPQAGLPAGAPFLLSVERQEARRLRIRVNERAAEQMEVPSLDISGADQDLMIGSHGEDLEVQQLDGDIFELMLLRGPVPERTRADLETYLRKKHFGP